MINVENYKLFTKRNTILCKILSSFLQDFLQKLLEISKVTFLIKFAKLEHIITFHSFYVIHLFSFTFCQEI